MKKFFELRDEAATLALGAQLAHLLQAPMFITLHGDLGVGKTTLVRALVNALVPGSKVKSPTYTLVETYLLPRFELHHFDLYRLDDPAELEHLGFEDRLTPTSVLLIEWPEKGRYWLPVSDLELRFDYREVGRSLCLESFSKAGEKVLVNLNNLL